MKELSINIKNCYGIEYLNEKFEFKRDNTVYMIYAPNGVMKTSFAKVFDDYRKGEESKDLIHMDKQSSVNIKIQNSEALKPESVFVIHPYDKNYKSDKISDLLINEELKQRYDCINSRLEVRKEELIDSLKILSDSKQDLESIISNQFMQNDNSFYSSLIKAKELLQHNKIDYSEITYDSVFEEKILTFLNTSDFKKEIKNYILKYNDIIDSSEYLSENFNHYNFSMVEKNLNSNGFFTANHSLNLKNGDNVEEIFSTKDLIEIINKEKERVLNNPELRKTFAEIDNKISNAQLRDFRQFLFEHQDILVELENIDLFRQKVILSYLNKSLTLVEALCSEYLEAQDEIKLIINKANLETTQWENVIDIFNRRFYVPFKLEIRNKHETILNRSVPTLSYSFMDKKDIDENLIINVLSQGERRALYLLNIIFEIESRKVQNLKTVFIIDDIADSFDYKNKYAIIEYLKEISSNSNFRSIILTHNFDFYRTVQDRIGMNKWENSLMANKDTRGINLERVKYSYICNPFNEWKKDLNKKCKLIASITFARNICEYTGDEETFKKLTSLLHIKVDTKDILVRDLEDMYKKIFFDLNDLSLEDGNKKVYDLIFEKSDELLNSEEEVGLNLENKIVLSIAIRLEAENFMIKAINDIGFVNGLKKYQTGRLFKKFKEKFHENSVELEILDKVNIMTPENIHLNSFMFEPILDLTDEHLKQLYESVKYMNNKTFEPSFL